MRAWRHGRLMQLIDDGALADPGITGDQHQARSSFVDYTIEGGEQGRDFALSPVQLFGDQQPVGDVAFAQRKWIDLANRFPFSQTTAKIMLEANRRLIAFLGRLGEQLHDDPRDLSRNALNPLARWHWLSCNIAMDPLHGPGGSNTPPAQRP